MSGSQASRSSKGNGGSKNDHKPNKNEKKNGKSKRSKKGSSDSDRKPDDDQGKCSQPSVSIAPGAASISRAHYSSRYV